MSRGRKRKPGRREPNGDIVRISAAQKAEDMRAVVLAQPHRRGSPSDRLWCPVGRLIEEPGYLPSQMSKAGLYEAAMRFAEAHARWQGVVGSARPYANSTAGGEMDDDQAVRYMRAWSDAWRELRQEGEMVERAVFAIVIDCNPEDYTPPHWIRHGALIGLVALAAHFGIDLDGADKERKAA
jgi:hypothetical protein